MKVAIIGDGAWGTALSSVVEENTSKIKSIKSPKEITILAIPTQAIREVLVARRKHIDIRNTIIVNGTKGIEKGTHFFPREIVKDVLGKDMQYFSLIGPSFAQEVSQKMPTIINLGYSSKKYLPEVKKVFQTSYMHVIPTPCIEALELAAAFKNIYSLAAGYSDGLGFGINTRVKLITLAFLEVQAMCDKLRYRTDNSVMPTALGDLVLTCSSAKSRNYMFGKLLVTLNPSDALRTINQTVEGYSTADSVSYFLKKTKVSLPVAKFVWEIIFKDRTEEIRREHLSNFMKLV